MDENLTDDEFQDDLRDLLVGLLEVEDLQIKRVSTFEEAGVLTMNSGLVVTLENGQTFQLTIVS